MKKKTKKAAKPRPKTVTHTAKEWRYYDTVNKILGSTRHAFKRDVMRTVEWAGDNYVPVLVTLTYEVRR